LKPAALMAASGPEHEAIIAYQKNGLPLDGKPSAKLLEPRTRVRMGHVAPSCHRPRPVSGALRPSRWKRPLMGSQSTEEEIVQPVDDTYRILVIGDALAGGLGAGLSRMAEPEPRFEIVNRFQETSGIARPEVYDWAASLPKIMEGKNSTPALSDGANDRQAIREGDFRLVSIRRTGKRPPRPGMMVLEFSSRPA
jgi:hypothetical protein